MLVLSRRQGQRILFPSLGITVSVLPASGSAVRLGIQAPSDVNVVREEIADRRETTEEADAKSRRARHDLLSHLNTLGLAIVVAQKQLKAGLTAAAEQTLQEAQAVLEKLPEAGAWDGHSEPRSKPLEALLVEDNVYEEALLSSYLRLSGIRVDTAHDGYEALEFLAGHGRPDFLLLDMQMPRCDGRATVNAIRENPAYRGLTIFAVTGSSPTEFALPTGQAGVDLWFQKPLNPMSIVSAMSAAATRN